MKLFSIVKGIFAIPTPKTLAIRELEEAQRLYLEACSAREYANSMTIYHEARIKRLTSYLQIDGK